MSMYRIVVFIERLDDEGFEQKYSPEQELLRTSTYAECKLVLEQLMGLCANYARGQNPTERRQGR